MNNALTLYELNNQVKDCLEERFPFPVWIIAEISEINARNHCYIELIQKDENTENLIAKSRATIWAHTYNMLKPYFEITTGYILQSGIKVMLRVEVQYSELYGISLNVKDIDPTYTLGDVERQRKEVLSRLKDDGILDMNKTIPIPLLPKTIAVISSAKAAGYQDFIKQLESCPSDYKFHIKLFPAIMQGEKSKDSIIAALEKVYENENIFNIVVLIRGGGAVSDLACFDTYELVAHIAQFPLPVITGIGHDKDVSIADRVANTALKTPTAVADFIIDRFHSCSDSIERISQKLSELTDDYFAEAYEQLRHCNSTFKYILPKYLQNTRHKHSLLIRKFHRIVKDSIRVSENQMNTTRNKLSYVLQEKCKMQDQQIHFLQERMKGRIRNFLKSKSEKLLYKEQVVSLLSPERLLERGYTITTLANGKILKDISMLKKGDLLNTKTIDGIVVSEVRHFKSGE